jgi:NADPH-dependent glutamate synthase beta subunit-like oxidoreductase
MASSYKTNQSPISSGLFEKREGDPPCRLNCPASVNAAAYVGLIAQGKFAQALDVIRQHMPFPGVCGRVCHHPCEAECNRGDYDKPVSIAALKRAAAEYGRVDGTTPSIQEKHAHSIAIIGSGPAGLTAAYDLRRKGYQITVFERESEPGGMIRAAIPFYRLPREVVDQDIRDILDIGIEMQLNVEVGKDITLRELEMHFDAILIAVGTQKSIMLKIEGIENEGVFWGVDYLRRVKSEFPPDIGEKVVVIGGGNVAVDAARTSLRLGAKEVSLACLELREQMPAHDWEINPAIEEGLRIYNCLGPGRIVGDENHKAVGIEMKRVKSLYDADGRFNPLLSDEPECFLEADTIIISIGQAADTYFLGDLEGIELDKRKLIDVDSVSLETGRVGIFASGDVVSGPKSIVDAVNAGHEAAESIHRFLNGIDLHRNRIREQVQLPVPEGMPVYDYERHVPDKPEAEERVEDFREEQYGLSREEAISEAKRCLNCGNCFLCGPECSLDISGGICPVIRCRKSSVNGPCGGSNDGLCETGDGEDCGWQLIYESLKNNGKLDNMQQTIPPKCWSYLETKYLEGSAVEAGAIGDTEMLHLAEED